jgi:hypothetical protein
MEARMLNEIGWTEPRGFLGPFDFEWFEIFEAITGCDLHTLYEYNSDSDLALRWLEHAREEFKLADLPSPYFQVFRWLELCCEHGAKISVSG